MNHAALSLISLLFISVFAQAQEPAKCIPALSLAKNQIRVEACGRVLEQVDISIAFVTKTPNKNRMPRLWRPLSAYTKKLVVKEGIVFDSADCFPKVLLAVSSEPLRNSFVQFQLKLIGKQCSKPLYYEGQRFLFNYTGQAQLENHQSYFSYYSFAFNGVMKEINNAIELEDGAPPYSATESILYVEKKGVAWWTTTLKAQGSPASLFLGAQSAKLWPTTFVINNKNEKFHQVAVYQGLQGDYLPVAKDQLINSDPVVISINNNSLKTMEEYGDRVASVHKPLTHKPQDWGWSSWYQYYTKIDLKIITRAKEIFNSKLKPLGFSLLQIDDGYQEKVGDWGNTKNSFPQGMTTLSSSIAKDGLKPGIWLAPFMVDKTSRLANSPASREWFLRDYRGKLLTYYIPGHSTNYILDVTHPAAEKWLRATIKNYRSWGYKYLKVDFLFLEATPAKRFNRQVTGMAAYQKGVALIHQEAGADVTLLHSGSIDLAGIGSGHANRVGPDIAYDIFSGNTRMTYIKAELTAAASHAFMGHRWFTPNTDGLMLREPLRDSLAEVLIAMSAMMSGDYILSDNIYALSDNRFNKFIHPTILDLLKVKGHVIPLDYFENTVSLKVAPNPLMIAWFYEPPRIWLWTNPKTSRKVLFLYNLDFSEVTLERDLNQLTKEVYGKPLFLDGAWHDTFHGNELVIKEGKMKITLPKKSVRIFPLY